MQICWEFVSQEFVSQEQLSSHRRLIGMPSVLVGLQCLWRVVQCVPSPSVPY
jgi:hypothetical protein